MKFVNKQELKYLGIATLFSFIFFVLILPNIIGSITEINPVFQFLIFNVGIFVFLQIFLKSLTTEKKIKVGYTIGVVILFMALDLLIPPFSVDVTGKFAQNITLVQSSSDYVIGLGWNALGITGFMLFFFTYVVSSFILFVIASLLLKNFVIEL